MTDPRDETTDARLARHERELDAVRALLLAEVEAERAKLRQIKRVARHAVDVYYDGQGNALRLDSAMSRLRAVCDAYAGDSLVEAVRRYLATGDPRDREDLIKLLDA